MINATIIGNLTRDPETRQVDTTTVTNFTIAVNRKVGVKEYTTYVRCALWGKRGTTFDQYHKKGDKAAVSGTLYNDEYDGKLNTNCDVSDWGFVKSGDSGSGGGGGDFKRTVDSPLPKRGPAAVPAGGFDPDDLPF